MDNVVRPLNLNVSVKGLSSLIHNAALISPIGTLRYVGTHGR